MNKLTLNEIIASIGCVCADRADFLRTVSVSGETAIEVSGTTKSYNYGETCEILLKIALGLNGVKENGKCADLVYNGKAYDIKAIDSYASATRGHNTDTDTTLIIANYKNYKGVYEIANNEIVWTKSGKMQRAETLAKAILNQGMTNKLLRA